MRREWIYKKNVISYNLPNILPEIEADELRIKQVLLNLITNSIKFSPDNSTIFVKVEARENDILIQVEDHGTGIPQADIPAIFNEYYRAGNRANVHGLCLGLHICQKIVTAHGGHIWAESVEGEGSTFSFTLPMAQTHH